MHCHCRRIPLNCETNLENGKKTQIHFCMLERKLPSHTHVRICTTWIAEIEFLLQQEKRENSPMASSIHTHTNRKIIVYSQLTSLQEIVSHLTNFPQFDSVCVCVRVCFFALLTMNLRSNSITLCCAALCSEWANRRTYTCNMSAHLWARYSQRL